MVHDTRIDLITRVAAVPPAVPCEDEEERSGSTSVFQLAAACYGARPDDASTVPTGFDPAAIALFEGIVEAAYLVAAADGVFDRAEQQVFDRIVAAACGGCVSAHQIEQLVGDFAAQLADDGVQRRIEAVASTLTRPAHALEALRVASLVALASDDVSDVERSVLGSLARATSLPETAVDQALADVRAALSSMTQAAV